MAVEEKHADQLSRRLAPAAERALEPGSRARPFVRGKFLFVGDTKFYIKGITYGPFNPDKPGGEYGTPEEVARDFAAMAEAGFNTIRLYTAPPKWLFDVALDHGLRLIIGLAWEQHITFLDGRKRQDAIVERAREAVRACEQHPAVLCFTLGNEIPASIVRWYGAKKVERFLERLYHTVKEEDPEALVTYVNFPTTEYLQLPFLDFYAFNVYLESEETLRPYLARLQNLAGDRPLFMAEIGLDSLRNGEQAQADTMAWQLRTVFDCGCAGVCVFSWTDEWHRGGHDIDDWAFGMTDRHRTPKPALDAVSNVLKTVPFDPQLNWPKISVLICTYNGSRTLRETLDSLDGLEYPNYEVVIVNDGSKDATPTILEDYPQFTVVSTENRGLSNARNTAMETATGEIVAYLDDDAYPDPHWLTYLALTFMSGDYVAVGGPNLPPPEDGFSAECVSHAPGNPSHVLLADDVAEHIPGCNMAIRRKALQAIGGFDPQFRIAGDDVDVCWRLQERDGVIGFSHAATVWHHRRGSIKAFMRQQTNYGRAEAMLEVKWPQKYNHFGHVPWAGRVYGPVVHSWLKRWRIDHGVWGTGLFQCMYAKPKGTWQFMPLMPEWYLLIIALALITIPSAIWTPLVAVVPLLLLAIVVPVIEAALHASAAPLSKGMTLGQRIKARALITMLHVTQPMMRLRGRLFSGLTLWRRPKCRRFAFPASYSREVWSERWQSTEQRLEAMEEALYRVGARVVRGGRYDRWDLEIGGGIVGRGRVLMAIEEHGGGKQMIKLVCKPTVAWPGMALLLLFSSIAVLAGVGGSLGAAILLGAMAGCLLVRTLGDCAAATATFLEVVDGAVEAEQALCETAHREGH
jgi:GT2 family glycosyltransferase